MATSVSSVMTMSIHRIFTPSMFSQRMESTHQATERSPSDGDRLPIPRKCRGAKELRAVLWLPVPMLELPASCSLSIFCQPWPYPPCSDPQSFAILLEIVKFLGSLNGQRWSAQCPAKIGLAELRRRVAGRNHFSL